MRRGALLSAGGRIVVALAGAATTVAVGRILGPAGFGVYSVALTLIVVLQVLTTLGIETGIVYYVSSGRWAVDDAFRTSQRVAFVCGAFCIGAALAVRTLVPNAFHGLTLPWTIVAASAVPFLLSWLLAAYVALAAGNYAVFITPSVIKEISGLVAITALALWKGAAGAIVGLAVANVVAAAAGVALVRKVAREPRNDSAPAVARAPRILARALRFGFKGSASNALQTINLRLDTFVLNAGVSTAVVGHYGLAVSITSVMAIMPGAFSDALFPRAAGLHRKGATRTNPAVRFAEEKSLRHCVIMTTAAGLVCALGLLLLVVPVYGAAFQPTILLGLMLLPGSAALAISAIITTTIVARGRPDVPLRVMLWVTPATVALYLILVPTLHATGAAIASSISYLATFSAMCRWYGRITGHGAFKTMMPTIADLTDYRDLLVGALKCARLRSARR